MSDTRSLLADPSIIMPAGILVVLFFVLVLPRLLRNLVRADRGSATAQRNPYGDQLKSSVKGFGSDVSSQRVEPFEQEMLNRAAELKRSAHEAPIALDLFSGYCAANGQRLAELGFITYAFDFGVPDASLFSVMGRRFASGGILRYLQRDVRKLALAPENVSLRTAAMGLYFDFSKVQGKIALVTAQRGLHFLRYAESRDLVATLAAGMQSGGSMFFSIGAVDCKVGAGYKHADLPVAQRWHPLEPELGGPIHVTEPLCLYKQEDVEALFADLAGRLVKLDRDDFGLFIVEFRKD